jgi:hypothetical protein
MTSSTQSRCPAGNDKSKVRIRLRPATKAEKQLIKRWLIQRLAEKIVEAMNNSVE